MGVDDVSPAPVSPSAETQFAETQPAQSQPAQTQSPRLAAAQQPDLLEGAVHLAVGAAWWVTGPIRLGGRLAARAAEAAVDELADAAAGCTPTPRAAPVPGPAGRVRWNC